MRAIFITYRHKCIRQVYSGPPPPPLPPWHVNLQTFRRTLSHILKQRNRWCAFPLSLKHLIFFYRNQLQRPIIDQCAIRQCFHSCFLSLYLCYIFILCTLIQPAGNISEGRLYTRVIIDDSSLAKFAISRWFYAQCYYNGEVFVDIGKHAKVIWKESLVKGDFEVKLNFQRLFCQSDLLVSNVRINLGIELFLLFKIKTKNIRE